MDTFEEIISVDNLLTAWQGFLPGKRKRADVRKFSQALMHNILTLHQDLADGSYCHGSYEAFRVSDPKPRNIHKATVRDRLLHHAIYRSLYASFDNLFIHDSYSCRDNKGTHRAFMQLVRRARKVSNNYTGCCFALKMDIRKFFESINHETLLWLLRKRIADENTLHLLENIIRSFEHDPGSGMPLGNLTSQLFANVYMDPLDKFVKHHLKARYYIRYADDFLILSSSRDELMGYFVEIWRFLREELKLELHPSKISLRKLSWGIDFVGYVARPHYGVPRRKTVKRMFSKLKFLWETDSPHLEASVQSYLGHLKHVSAYQKSEKLKSTFQFLK